MGEITTQKTETGLSYKNVSIAQTGGGGMLLPQTFGEVVAFATMMARSQHAIPKHLRENDGACMAVTMQALRWEMDPFMVASKSYNVKDLIAYEAQLVAAVVNTRAPIKKRPVYEYEGEGDTRRCIVSCEMLDGSTKTYESPQVGKILTKNSPLWKADTDQQLGYFSIRSWARRHTPEVILGVYTPDEADQFSGPDNAKDITPQPSVLQRLRGQRQDDTQRAEERREGFDASFSHPETVDALTGEILDDNETTESGSSPEPDADAPPLSASAEGVDIPPSTPSSIPDATETPDGGPASGEDPAGGDHAPDQPPAGSTLSRDQRAKLIEAASKFMKLAQEKISFESREADWKDVIDPAHWPKLESLATAARAVINSKRTPAQAFSFMAEVLGCSPADIGG